MEIYDEEIRKHKACILQIAYIVGVRHSEGKRGAESIRLDFQTFVQCVNCLLLLLVVRLAVGYGMVWYRFRRAR